eukprot:gene17202-23701_t
MKFVTNSPASTSQDQISYHHRSIKSLYSWTQFLAKCITLLAIMFSVVAIIGYSYDLYRHGRKKHLIGWFSSAGFVLLTIPISVRLIVSHLSHWYAPNIQKYIVRIIWMIPIYSVESWLALRFKSFALYIETIRECYEAYVIFSFLYFLIALLGEEQHLVSLLKRKSAEYGTHPWPINMVISPWIMGPDLLHKCKLGVLQYVVIKNVTAIIVFILVLCNQYQEGQFRFDKGYLYVCLINNISQLWALYCLLLFYYATKEELQPWRPVGKFLCVKMVVFFTWWQAIIINIINSASNNIIVSNGSWTGNEIAKGLQDYFICIEMFFASIAFTLAFTYKDYVKKSRSKYEKEIEVEKPFLSAFFQSSMPDDIFADI